MQEPPPLQVEDREIAHSRIHSGAFQCGMQPVDVLQELQGQILWEMDPLRVRPHHPDLILAWIVAGFHPFTASVPLHPIPWLLLLRPVPLVPVHQGNTCHQRHKGKNSGES